jgi:hypothetical protein
MTVKDLMDSMDIRELQYWMAYHKIVNEETDARLNQNGNCQQSAEPVVQEISDEELEKRLRAVYDRH